MSPEERKKLDLAMTEVIRILKESSDVEVGEILGNGRMNEFLKAILDPASIRSHSGNIGEFFLKNKHRGWLLALTRLAITQNYSLQSEKDGQYFASPCHIQWFKDGVMILEGRERFGGFIGVYRNGEAQYAVAARDRKGGDSMGPDDFKFVSIEEFNKGTAAIPLKQLSNPELPLQELKTLLEQKNDDESKYQEFFVKYPWLLGAQYKKIQDHKALDEQNIPDFTGVRAKDSSRDIIEIKQPFLSFFKANGDFTADFHNAWAQAERYLSFAKEEKEYLGRKGLNFDNPKCYLLAGHGLSEKQRERIRKKERLLPAIEFLTYEEILAFATNTVGLLVQTKNGPTGMGGA